MDLIGSDLKVAEGLFKDVSYYITGNIHESVEALLKDGGGKKYSYLSDTINHVIAADPNSDEITIAKELFELPVVTISWVIRSVQCNSLLPTQVFDPDPSFSLFAGVVVCPSEISAVDNKLVWAIVTTYGGKYQLVLNKTVTHLVTTDAKGAKYNRVCTLKNNSIKVVTPDWILESIQAKTCMDEKRFHPRLFVRPAQDDTVQSEVAVSSLHDGVASLKLAAASLPHSVSSDSSAAMTNADILSNLARVTHSAVGKGRKISGVRPNKKLTAKVRPVPDVSSALADFGKQASSVADYGALPLNMSAMSPRSHLKNIGNSGVVSRTPKSSSKAGGSAKLTSYFASSSSSTQPLLQHFPVLNSTSTHGSGYAAISAAIKTSAEPDVKSYCGHDPSEHVPQDVCLLGCVFYIADYQKFIEPPVLEMWRKVISQYGGQVDESYSNRITHVLCEHQKSDVYQLALRDGKRLVTIHWLYDCLEAKKMLVPSAALHFPYVFGSYRPACNQMVCITNFEGDERVRVKNMLQLVGAKYTGYLTRANSIVIAKCPGGVKYSKALEWNLPVVGIQWLNDVVMGDLNAFKLPIRLCYRVPSNQPTNYAGDVYNVEIAKVSHLLEGWRTPLKISKEIWKKFQTSQHLLKNKVVLSEQPVVANERNVTTTSNTADKMWLLNDSCSPEKKLRFSNADSSIRVPVIALTGIPEDEVARLSKDIIQLGGQVATSIKVGCTHLVANNIKRTVKFLMSLSVVQHIVTVEWVLHSISANRFLEESAFRLRDAMVEEAFNFNLQTSLSRALQQKLFKDLTFYFTPGVLPSKAVLSEIVRSSSGKVAHKRPSVNHLIKLVNNKGEQTFVIISCEADLYLLNDVHAHGIGIHSAEFIVTGVMRQEIDFITYRFQ